MSPRVEVRDLCMTFPGVVALDNVTLEVQPGEIHALLGENGAGKSTLGKIIGGIHTPLSGQVIFDGQVLGPIDEPIAGSLGIGIVHQEGSLVAQLSVAENIFAGRQPTTFLGQIDWRQLRARARAVLDLLGVDLDPAVAVAELSPAQTQIVEIAKAVSHDLKLLILDEPTAALTLTETVNLFTLVRRLARQGVAVIYVSHRLAEIFELCDTVTVLKDGRKVGTRAVKDITPDELIRMMVGREVHFKRETSARVLGEVALSASGIAAGAHVRDASIDVRRGEIVCLAGLVGSGRTEFCEAIFGARHRDRGAVTIKGRPFNPSGPWDALAVGLGMVCEDRKSAGLFLDVDIASNIAVTVLGKVTRSAMISQSRLNALAGKFIADLNIATPSADQVVGNLSGGNQQKVLLAKWLALEPDVLIVDEPTRGVDVGARSEIYRILRQLAGNGMALLVVSSDLPEVLALADRIVVMADGSTVGALDGEGATEEAVLRLATAGTHDGSRRAA